MRPHHVLAISAALALGAACCAEPTHDGGGAAKPPPHHTAPAGGTAAPTGTINTACRLPAPKVGTDTCATDADCAPAEPCHAKECVAKAKAPPHAGVMCTQILECNSTDVNHCGCHQGHCALIPPAGP